jgi:hypothetical protein
MPPASHHRQFCSRKVIFVCSFIAFAVSLLLVNLSFTNGLRTLHFGPYLLHSSTKRNVLELTADSQLQSPMELPSLDQLPAVEVNETAELALKQEQQTKDVVFDPLARGTDTTAAAQAKQVGDPKTRTSTGSTLVVYVFQNRDEEAVRNFEFFLDNGLLESDDVDYVLIVQHLQQVRFLLLPEDMPMPLSIGLQAWLCGSCQTAHGECVDCEAEAHYICWPCCAVHSYNTA